MPLSVFLNRRQVLRLIAATSVVPFIPTGFCRASGGGGAGGFLTADELAILDAAMAVILPSGEHPGAREIGAVGYVQSLLSFMPGSDANCDRFVNAADTTAIARRLAGSDGNCPQGGDVNGDGDVNEADLAISQAAPFRARPVFAGGPFSGRNPQPHFPIGTSPCSTCHGSTVTGSAAGSGNAVQEVYPPNAFRQHLPLSRLQALSWKARLLGPQAVPEIAANPLAADMPEVDMRRKYRDGLAALDQGAQERFPGNRFTELSTAAQTQVLALADQRFVKLLMLHAIDAVFCAPEYGGNRNQLGWQLARFDGDSQPLGYEIYDESEPGHYRERPDKPNSRPNPDEDCSGFSAAMAAFLGLISGTPPVQPGRPFPQPYCFVPPEE